MGHNVTRSHVTRSKFSCKILRRTCDLARPGLSDHWRARVTCVLVTLPLKTTWAKSIY